ncbi:hypothetical protein HMI54_010271, partial [Coelomomyces lativittatus]
MKFVSKIQHPSFTPLSSFIDMALKRRSLDLQRTYILKSSSRLVKVSTSILNYSSFCSHLTSPSSVSLEKEVHSSRRPYKGHEQRTQFWRTSERELKKTIAKSHALPMMIFSKLPNTVVPLDLLHVLLSLPGFKKEHLLYMIQERSLTHLYPTGRWLVRLSSSPLPSWGSYLNSLLVSGKNIKYQVLPITHKQESKFLHPLISRCSGIHLLLWHVPSFYQLEDLLHFFKPFALHPQQPSDLSSSITKVASPNSQRYYQAIVHVQSEADAYQVLRTCQTHRIPCISSHASSSSFATTGSFFAPYKAKLSILTNLVPIQAWPY